MIRHARHEAGAGVGACAVDATDLHRRGLGLGTQAHTSELAQRIVARIDALGLTRTRFVNRARISRQTLDNLLEFAEGRGGAMPSIRTSILLAHALRVHPAWLIEGLFTQVAVDARIDVRMHAHRAPNVEDLNYADGAVVAPGTRFVKQWRIHRRGGSNDGSSAPWRGVRLVCQDVRVTARSAATGERLHAFGHLDPECASVPLPDLRPGESADIAVTFTAPATSGCVVSRWLAVGPDGQPWADPAFGVWVAVHVTTLADTLAFVPMTAIEERGQGPYPPLSRCMPVGGTGTTDRAAVSTFAQRVLQRAKTLGLTKKALAERAQLSRQTLDNLLALGAYGDAQIPTVRTLLCLALALKVHPYWLVDGVVADVRLSLPLRNAMAGDRTGYVEDGSCPDGCVVQPGAQFDKVWTAQALGEVAWQGRKLACWDDRVIVTAHNAQGAAVAVHRLVPDVREVPAPQPAPGDVFSLAVGFTAPREPGVAVTCWMPTYADGRPAFGEHACLWALVHVQPHGGQAFGHPEAVASEHFAASTTTSISKGGS